MIVLYLILVLLLTFLYSILFYLIKAKKYITYIWFFIVLLVGLVWFSDVILRLPNKLLPFGTLLLFLLFITPFIFNSGYRVNKNCSDILGFCVLYPIGEELIFRAIILKLIPYIIGENSVMVPFPLLKEISLPVLITAFLFGVMHLQYFKFKINRDTLIKIVFAFIFGIFMGNMVEITESILYPVIFHVIANTGATIYYFKNNKSNYIKILIKRE